MPPAAASVASTAALHAATRAQSEPQLDSSLGGQQVEQIGQRVTGEWRPELERKEPGARLRVGHETLDRSRRGEVQEQVRGARAVQPVARRVARAIHERDRKRPASQAHAQQLARSEACLRTLHRIVG